MWTALSAALDVRPVVLSRWGELDVVVPIVPLLALWNEEAHLTGQLCRVLVALFAGKHIPDKQVTANLHPF
jgi:hypothetical protein